MMTQYKKIQRSVSFSENNLFFYQEVRQNEVLDEAQLNIKPISNIVFFSSSFSETCFPISDSESSLISWSDVWRSCKFREPEAKCLEEIENGGRSDRGQSERQAGTVFQRQREIKFAILWDIWKTLATVNTHIKLLASTCICDEVVFSVLNISNTTAACLQIHHFQQATRYCNQVELKFPH